MAGHSKWANIKHRKAAQDSKRGKVFTKVARELTVAAKLGGGDAEMNPRLRLALDKARSVNMPKDNVERAIKKGTGEGMDTVYEDINYEGYGPAGIAIIVSALTDNRNRTVSEVRMTFSKRGGSMGDAGSVNWMFEQKGVIGILKEKADEDTVMEIAMEHGAEDIDTEGEAFEVVTAGTDFMAVKNAFEAAGIETEYAEYTMRSKNTIPAGIDEAKKLMNLIEALEDLDDVQEVFHNAEIDDAVMEELEA